MPGKKTPKPITRGNPRTRKQYQSAVKNNSSNPVVDFGKEIVNSYKRVGQYTFSGTGLTKDPYMQKGGGYSVGKQAMDFAGIIPVGRVAGLGVKAVAKGVTKVVGPKIAVRSATAATRVAANGSKKVAVKAKIAKPVIVAKAKVATKLTSRGTPIGKGAENLTKKTSTLPGRLEFKQELATNAHKIAKKELRKTRIDLKTGGRITRLKQKRAESKFDQQIFGMIDRGKNKFDPMQSGGGAFTSMDTKIFNVYDKIAGTPKAVKSKIKTVKQKKEEPWKGAEKHLKQTAKAQKSTVKNAEKYLKNVSKSQKKVAAVKKRDAKVVKKNPHILTRRKNSTIPHRVPGSTEPIGRISKSTKRQYDASGTPRTASTRAREQAKFAIEDIMKGVKRINPKGKNIKPIRQQGKRK